MLQWNNYIDDADAEHSVSGRVLRYPQYYSPQLQNTRDILVYLPPGHSDPARRFPVIYMHDGQNLFDHSTSFAGEWHVDETLEGLALSDDKQAIVVGIPNLGEARIREYSPFDSAYWGHSQGDAYLAFLCDTLKPMIDGSFPTLPGRRSTGILGSSMGGLISLYAFFARADVFGLVGALSPALWFNRRTIFPYIEQSAYVDGRIYIDAGAREGSPKSRRSMADDASRMAELLRHKGYRNDHTLRHHEDAEGEHREEDWARRLPDALRFLLSE